MEFSLHPSIDWSSSKKKSCKVALPTVLQWRSVQLLQQVKADRNHQAPGHSSGFVWKGLVSCGTLPGPGIQWKTIEWVLQLLRKGAHFWNTLIKTRLLLALWGSYTECVGTCLRPLCCFEHEFHKPVEKDFVAFNLIIYSNSSISVWRLLFNSIGIGFQQQQRQTHAALPLRCVCAVLALSVCLKTCAQSFEFVES